MPQETIFAPMGALALLTFVVLTIIPFRRVSAARAGKITGADFKYGESSRVPGEVSIPNRNYMNLLEMPLLFYTICLMLFVTARVTPIFLDLAWLYVGLRLAHSVVHLTFNHVLVRLAVFATSNFVVIAMWALFFLGPRIP